MSLVDQLSKFVNPAPTFEDPEDDNDVTAASIRKEVYGGDDDVITPGRSKLRQKAVSLLEDEDRRYSGKKVSRKALIDEDALGEQISDDDDEEEDSSDVEDDDDDSAEENVSGSVEGSGTSGEVESGEEEIEEDEDELDAFRQKMKQKVKRTKKDSFVFEGTDDFGQFGDDSDGDGQIDDDDDDSETGSEDESGSDEDDEESEEEDEDMDEDEDETGGVQKFSKSSVQEEVAKGIATRNQLRLWDELLKLRIKLQGALSAANTLPQGAAWGEFAAAGSDEYRAAVKDGQKAVKKLLEQLVSVQASLFQQNPETKYMCTEGGADAKKRPAADDDDEEIPSDSDVEEEVEDDSPKKQVPHKKLRLEEYPSELAKRHKDFTSYRNNTIQKWYDKTRVASGKLDKKGFTGFEQSAVKKIDEVLSDKDRLIKRTQLKRTTYRVIGKPEKEETEEPPEDMDTEERLPSREHLKDYDEEIFDDDDFYGQLLRELIARKTQDIDDPIALGRQYLEIDKLRSKIKKKVDTRASKGRKVRYDVHKKLVNFMAPVENTTWTDEAKDDLFSSLFGKRKDTATES